MIITWSKHHNTVMINRTIQIIIKTSFYDIDTFSNTQNCKIFTMSISSLNQTTFIHSECNRLWAQMFLNDHQLTIIHHIDKCTQIIFTCLIYYCYTINNDTQCRSNPNQRSTSANIDQHRSTSANIGQHRSTSVNIGQQQSTRTPPTLFV